MAQIKQRTHNVVTSLLNFMDDKFLWVGKIHDLYPLLEISNKQSILYIDINSRGLGVILQKNAKYFLSLGIEISIPPADKKRKSRNFTIKCNRLKESSDSILHSRIGMITKLIIDFMEDKHEWFGPAKKLYILLHKAGHKNKLWTSDISAFSRAITVSANALRKNDIDFRRYVKEIHLINHKVTEESQKDESPLVLEDLELRRERAEVKKWKRSYEESLKRIEEMRVQQEVIDTLPGIQAPVPILPSKGDSCDEAVAVFMTSDWHIEEKVDPKTIEGRNEYNPEIASRRLRKMWKSALKVIEKERKISTINECVVAVLGDLITGYIHDELLESNFLSPTQAIELAQEELVAGLTFFADNGKFDIIHVPCCIGNHGRTTQKRRVSTANTNSYEWFMYRQVAKYFQDDDRFSFSVADGYHLSQDVLGTNLRYHHGESIRFGGGVGGLTIPFNKAVQAWNKNNPKPADFDCMGHYHSLHFLPDGIINGSVIGWNAFANSIKARFEEPQQALFLVAKDHGPTCFNRIWCD